VRNNGECTKQSTEKTSATMSSPTISCDFPDALKALRINLQIWQGRLFWVVPHKRDSRTLFLPLPFRRRAMCGQSARINYPSFLDLSVFSEARSLGWEPCLSRMRFNEDLSSFHLKSGVRTGVSQSKRKLE
jgi:hypothetical protein